MLPFNRDHKERARELRKNTTDAERLLWSEVRRKQIFGAQFFRQKPIDQYVVDFYCPAAQLVVEVDGEQHREEDHEEGDRIRDRALRALGLTVLRFSNAGVLQRRDAVVTEIEDAVSRALSASNKRHLHQYSRPKRHRR
ncbi:MAG TPA: endonuclease domain-containing protein [Thermoanaerobaculia bacterium]